jgi:hypothetical protein
VARPKTIKRPIAKRRYLEFFSTIEDDKAGTDKLNKISQPVAENDRSSRGFNFFDPDDQELFEALGRGKVPHQWPPEQRPAPVGEEQKHTPSFPPDETPAHPRTDQEKRETYKYHLSSLGTQVIALGLKLKNVYVIPDLKDLTIEVLLIAESRLSALDDANTSAPTLAPREK